MNWDTDRLGPFPILHPGATPAGFDNPSRLCRPENRSGTLLTTGGERLSWMFRRRFAPSLKLNGEDHLAKTPFYAIRYAIDRWTEPGDLVLDPFMGSGTTGIEAMLQGRKTWGSELEFSETTRVNLAKFGTEGTDWALVVGDAEIALDQVPDNSVSLVNFSNPYPEGRDHSVQTASSPGNRIPEKSKRIEELGYLVKRRYKNKDSAGLMSGDRYWQKMKAIQDKACEKLKPGGYAVFVIKDILKSKRVIPLHEQLADLLPDSMEFQSTFLLEHYPPTLHMNTYEKRWGVRPPMEQICPVFRKRG